MNRLRVLLERLRGGRRPPTGPMTTDERSTADKLERTTAAKEAERVEREERGSSS
jgi:hypothetical protein